MFGESLVVDYYSTYEISMSLNVVDVQFSIYNGLTICLGFKFLYLGRICLELYFMKNTCCCQCIMDDSLHWGLLPLNCLQQNKQNPSSHVGYSPRRYTHTFLAYACGYPISSPSHRSYISLSMILRIKGEVIFLWLVNGTKDHLR